MLTSVALCITLTENRHVFSFPLGTLSIKSINWIRVSMPQCHCVKHGARGSGQLMCFSDSCVCCFGGNVSFLFVTGCS